MRLTALLLHNLLYKNERRISTKEEVGASLAADSPLLREDEEEDSLTDFEVSLAPPVLEEPPLPREEEEEEETRAAALKFSKAVSNERLRLSMASMMPATN